MISARTINALQTWSSVARWTVFGTVGCMIVSVGFSTLAFFDLGPQALQRAVLCATILPIVLGGPLFFFLSARLRSLAIVNRRLGMVARTDSLTCCLNRGAFTSKVNALLAQQNSTNTGALLMIDADNFKAINDSFGHTIGDEALTAIARSIRSILRAGDLVGRMGGEEFAVYLPGVDQEDAEAIAERIRCAVGLVDFAPNGRHRSLSVSIGGTVFAGATSFSSLFRIADQGLYGAKQTGRNRVTIVHQDDYALAELRQSA